MFHFDKFKKPGDNISVVLAREPSKLLRNEHFNKLEPQSLKNYYNHQASVYIDSLTDNATGNPLNLAIQNSTLFARYVNKLCVSALFMTWISPNVNPRNNTITFYSTNSTLNHTVSIPEGFYLTPSDIMDALVIALNSATGASGLTFSHLINPLQPSSSVLTAAGGSYHFILSSPMILKGTHLIGIPLSQTDSVSKTVGSIQLYYTRWVDIVSTTLTKHTSNANTSNKFGNNSLLLRSYTNKNLNGITNLFELIENRNWMRWDISENISNVDIRILDEFGDLLYVPQYALDNNSFTWGLELSTTTF